MTQNDLTYDLIAEPLSAEAFAAYGDVIETDGHPASVINQGRAERFRDLAMVDVEDRGGWVRVDLVEAQPERLPMRLRLMERHPLGSQIFMPISGYRYVVIVADGTPPPTAERLRAFWARPDQGVNYRKGVWHHPIIALDAVSQFLTVERDGPGDNLNETEIVDGSVQLRLT
ncbi:ureidoglycolate lyase [Salinisphaera sp. SPP-AMP-43]|uniref:ureidoglycolate lyase n=1 Tax=Salinisphaera sp. SPP-AMP-43 TaxID=3121288 RepID=UPI003C6E19C9